MTADWRQTHNKIRGLLEKVIAHKGAGAEIDVVKSCCDEELLQGAVPSLVRPQRDDDEEEDEEEEEEEEEALTGGCFM